MKTKLLIKFNANNVDEPLTYNLIKKFDVEINILKADIDYNLDGTLLIEIDTTSKVLSEIVEYFESRKITYDFIPNSIKIDPDTCTDCGLCTSACFINALSLNKDSWSLEFDSDKCLGCMSCISVCPSQAISSNIK